MTSINFDNCPIVYCNWILLTCTSTNLSPRLVLLSFKCFCLTIRKNEFNCTDEGGIQAGDDEIACKWGYDGSQGSKYQILAGPVFNNVYPFAGIFMGILADRFNRKILLGFSLLFWSLATGATGFAQAYWMLVIFRLLLAIG